jgi:hypothetical protein
MKDFSTYSEAGQQGDKLVAAKTKVVVMTLSPGRAKRLRP